MKKKYLIIAFIIIVSLLCSVIGCSGNNSSEEGISESDSTKVYTVTFDFDNGNKNYTVRYEEGSLITEIETPTKQPTKTEEYEFDGWYYSGEKWDFKTGIVNRDITLKAKWNVKKYTGDLPIRR